MSLSTHVLDTARGRPAPGLLVRLQHGAEGSGDSWTTLAEDRTGADGRITGWPTGSGTHRLVFETGEYLGEGAFYPVATVVFQVHEAERHHHIPLLLSPFGYSTYLGS
ncbi:hydroxyisourate hydrolase [Sciscionella sediminilitoris]|uniref:hydroxyisourate hydrolase n=1 Tax=Sciscionella sediminilitoris TaxID=1445613 RepID=UPI0004DF6324|nr:hydroxyisourate hydrolase [Sciscionella sp. SE31]